MVEPNPNSHVHQKQDGETTYRLEVAGEEGVGDCAETQEEQNSCRGSHGTFVEDGNVNALDFFAEVVGFISGARHRFSIPWGV